MLYLKKKMYAAKMYTSPSDKCKLDIKGIALTRGDSAILTKNLQLTAIKLIIENPHSAWESVKQLVNNEIATIKDQGIEAFIQSKKLGANYKHPDRQIQVCVVNKMRERGHSVPAVGDRVSYVIGMESNGGSGVRAMADCPNHIANINYNHYIQSLIFRPMKDILSVLRPDWKSFFNM